MDIKGFDTSNFILRATAETCKGCGLCSKRCPMNALEMQPYAAADSKLNKKGVVPRLTAETCLGCGVCVVKCPSKSLILEAKAYVTDPPKTAVDWVKDYWRVKKEGA